MVLRLAVFALLALGLAGFGTVAWLSLRPPPPVLADAPPPPAPHLRILAAGSALRAGTLLKPDDLASQDVAAAPPGALLDRPDLRAGLTGAMVRRSLAAGAAVTADDVMRPGDHGFLAAVLGPDMRAATVGVDNVSGSAGLIWPGDRVDLILTLSLDDPTVSPAHKVAAETVLSDLRVIAIDQLLARGVAPAAEPAGMGRTVTLEVTPVQAERIAVATRIGRLSLAVRAADSPAADQPGPVRTIWGGDVSPALARPNPGDSRDAAASLRLFLGGADGKEFRF